MLSWFLMCVENIQIPYSLTTRLSTIFPLLNFPNLLFTALPFEPNSLTISTACIYLNIQWYFICLYIYTVYILYACMHAKSFQSCLSLCNPMDYSPQGSPSMGFFRQEYWRGFPCPPPGDLPNQGTEPAPLTSPALAGRFFTTSATWQALWKMGILQARTLKWVAIPSSRRSSQPRGWPQVFSHITDRFFTIWATRKPKNIGVGSLSLL